MLVFYVLQVCSREKIITSVLAVAVFGISALPTFVFCNEHSTNEQGADGEDPQHPNALQISGNGPITPSDVGTFSMTRNMYLVYFDGFMNGS